ncbi:ArnT family glycosyltransferase [Candidatus Margulisiibacteriota bacterium]
MNYIRNIFEKPDTGQRAILGLIVLLYLCFAMFHINDPLVYDETDFVLMNEKALHNHPPMFSGCMYFIKHFISNQEFVIRGFGLLLNLLSAFFVFKIAELIKKNTGILAMAIYLLLPAVIQGSTLLDNDNTFLNLMLLIFCYVYMITPKSKYRYIYYFFLIFLALWSKDTTSRLLIIFFPLFELYAQKSIKKALYMLIALSGGYFLFKLGLYGVSQWSGIDFYNELITGSGVSVTRLLPRLLSIKFYLRAAYSLNSISMWVSPYLLLLLVPLIKDQLTGKRDKNMVLLISLTIFITAVYFLIKVTAAGFPKYVYPVFAMMAVISAVYLADKKIWAITLCGLAFLFFYFVLGDPLKTPFVAKLHGLNNKGMIITMIKFYLQVYIILLVPLVVLIKFNKKSPWHHNLIILFFAYIFCINVHQAKANYNVRYAYGEKGFADLNNYLVDNKISYEEILVRKSTIYYLTDKKMSRNGVNNVLFADIKIKMFLERLNNEKIKYICFSKNAMDVNPEKALLLAAMANKGFLVSERFDDYLVYKKISDGPLSGKGCCSGPY